MPEVTNVSERVHRYVDPANNARRYRWEPGETLNVPDDIAEAVLQSHEGIKLIRGRHPAGYEDRAADNGTYEDRQMVPARRRPGRPPKNPAA